MSKIKIRVTTEKQVSAELDMDEVIDQVNTLPFSQRIPFIIKMLDGITEKDTRFLPYSVGLTLNIMLKEKAQLIENNK